MFRLITENKCSSGRSSHSSFSSYDTTNILKGRQNSKRGDDLSRKTSMTNKLFLCIKPLQRQAIQRKRKIQYNMSQGRENTTWISFKTRNERMDVIISEGESKAWNDETERKEKTRKTSFVMSYDFLCFIFISSASCLSFFLFFSFLPFHPHHYRLIDTPSFRRKTSKGNFSRYFSFLQHQAMFLVSCIPSEQYSSCFFVYCFSFFLVLLRQTNCFNYDYVWKANCSSDYPFKGLSLLLFSSSLANVMNWILWLQRGMNKTDDEKREREKG